VSRWARCATTGSPDARIQAEPAKNPGPAGTAPAEPANVICGVSPPAFSRSAAGGEHFPPSRPSCGADPILSIVPFHQQDRALTNPPPSLRGARGQLLADVLGADPAPLCGSTSTANGRRRQRSDTHCSRDQKELKLWGAPHLQATAQSRRATDSRLNLCFSSGAYVSPGGQPQARNSYKKPTTVKSAGRVAGRRE